MSPSDLRLPAIGVAALIALIATAPGCAPPEEASGGLPNVLLISVDTLRADHLGSYGYERPTSPAIDALAARGVRFERAFSPASWTLPAHMSLMTSRYPHVHGVDRQERSLSPDGVTLAQTLSAAGFHTAGFISWFYVSGRYGFDRGFDDWFEYLPARHNLALSVRAGEIVDDALGWLGDPARDAERPFFLFVHLFDPHMNYDPPPPWDRGFDAGYDGTIDGSYGKLKRYIRGVDPDAPRIAPRDLEHVVALYDGELRYVDGEIGRLVDGLDRLGLTEDTLVILTSDHGEEFDDHGSMEGHQWTLYDEVTRVPLIVAGPGVASGHVSGSLVETLDVAPTVLDWLELPRPEGFQGRSLAPELAGQLPTGEPRFVFSEIRRFNHKWAIRSDTHKLVFTGGSPTDDRGRAVPRGYELYDLVADPGEVQNRFDPQSPLAQELAGYLRRFIESDAALLDREGETVTFSEEELERLRALGYVQ